MYSSEEKVFFRTFLRNSIEDAFPPAIEEFVTFKKSHTKF